MAYRESRDAIPVPAHQVWFNDLPLDVRTYVETMYQAFKARLIEELKEVYDE